MSTEENSQPASYLLDGTPFRSAPLSRSFQKSQYLLGFTLAAFFLKHAVSRVLFVTLTFPDHVDSTREASRRLNSFLNDIRDRYGAYIWVLEPQKDGVIHFHILVPVEFSAHAGTNLDAWSDRQHHTDDDRHAAMNPSLTAESDWWETKAPAFSFGRVRVEPIHSNGQAVGNYLTKQEWRAWHWPFQETKNVRFWSCSRNARAGKVKISWATRGGQMFRAGLANWAKQNDCHTYEDLSVKIGRHWGYYFHSYLRQREHESVPTMPEVAPATEGSSKENERPQAGCASSRRDGGARSAAEGGGIC